MYHIEKDFAAVQQIERKPIYIKAHHWDFTSGREKEKTLKASREIKMVTFKALGMKIVLFTVEEHKK